MAKENLEQAEAFNYYYALGRDRNLRMVADKFKISLVSIRRWSSKFNWTDRVLERDSKNAARIEQAVDKEIVRNAIQYREMIGKLVGMGEKDIVDGKLEFKSIKELADLIRLDMEIAGPGGLGGDSNDNIQSLVEILKLSHQLASTNISDDIDK